MPDLLKVLLLDDNPDDRLLIIRELKKLFIIDVEEIIHSREFEISLNRLDFDIVITEYQLKWTTGIEVLLKIKTINPHLPVIMHTGSGSEEIAVMAMKVGLDDYILKSPQHYARLALSVNSSILRMKEELLRKKAENALKVSESNYRELIENIVIGFAKIDTGFNIIMVNKAYGDLFKLTPEELKGKKCYSLYDQSHLCIPGKSDYFQDSDKMPVESLAQGIKSDNSTFDVLRRTFPTYNEKGLISGYIEIIEDISGKLRSERIQEVAYNIANAVLETDDLHELILGIRSELSKVIDTSNLSVYLWDNSKEIFSVLYKNNLDFNDTIPNGKTLERFVIKSEKGLLFCHEEIMDMMESKIIDYFESDIMVWMGVPLRSRTSIIGILVLQNYVSKSALATADLDILKFVSNQIGIAINNRMAIDNLRESELKFRSIIEQSADGVVIVDNKGNIVEWNHTISKMLMISQENAIGKKAWEIHNELIDHSQFDVPDYTGLTEMFNSMISLLREQESFVHEYNLFLKNGISKFFHVTLFLTRINGKEHLSAFLREIINNQTVD